MRKKKRKMSYQMHACQFHEVVQDQYFIQNKLILLLFYNPQTNRPVSTSEMFR